MNEQRFAEGHSPVHRLDPRLRIIVSLLLSFLIALSTRLPVQIAGFAAGALAVAAARLPLGGLCKRLAAVNVFILFLWVLVPFSYDGTELARIGPLVISSEGVHYALAITLKCNAIMLISIALMGTIDMVSFAHALRHLRLPEKLIFILTLMTRYVRVLGREYRRLANAMKIRCFRPRTNLFSYRTYGYLVGMLLVKSFDRSEHILNAMKCRGFQGHFYMLWHFKLARRDLLFAAASAIVLLMLGWMQWCPTTF